MPAARELASPGEITAVPPAHGDEAAFEALVRRYQRPLARFLYGLVQDRELAADLCQEVFLAAYRALPRLGGEAHLAGWLYAIALNQARAALRRRRLVHWIRLLPAAHDRAAGGSDPAERHALGDELRMLLEHLPLDQRACLLLQAEGFSYAEIARSLGCSTDAVRLRLFRARRACQVAYAQAPGRGGRD